MLRAENSRQRDAFSRRDAVDDMPEPAIDRRVVADDANAGALQPVRGEKKIRSETNSCEHPLQK
jgi:hypothetical protein